MKPDLKVSAGDSGAQPAGEVHAVVNIDTPIGYATNPVVSVGTV